MTLSNNPWSRWSALSPQPALLVGEVISQADGESVILLPGGSLITATGTGVAVGQMVFVRGGKVEGLAPALEQIEIEV